MKRDFPKIDPAGVRTYSITDRPSKVLMEDLGRPWTPGGDFSDFLAFLPDILGAADLKSVIRAWAGALAGGHTVAAGMGAHVIKVGLSPVFIDLMEQNLLHALALNGAGIIHDFELALAGKTSEDVAAAIGDGSFGMARETCAFLNEAIREAAGDDIGLGAAVGRKIHSENLAHADKSLLAQGWRRNIPVTVHVAVGTDIIHMHPGFDGAAAGAASLRDFHLFTGVAASLADGVFLNIGSAVLIPEVFLKALTLARNLGYAVHPLTTVNCDFIRQYRPMTNVVSRPTQDGGRGYSLTGPHELLIPLIAAGLKEIRSGKEI